MSKYVKKSGKIEGDIDINLLAELISDRLSKAIPSASQKSIEIESKDQFNNSASMDDLAKSMIVQRGNSKSNFDDLGGTKETKSDNQTNDTIDFLSNMED